MIRRLFVDPQRSCRYCGHRAEAHEHYSRGGRGRRCSAKISTGKGRTAFTAACDCQHLDQRREWVARLAGAASDGFAAVVEYAVGLILLALHGRRCVTCGRMRELSHGDHCLGCVIDGHARTVRDVVDR